MIFDLFDGGVYIFVCEACFELEAPMCDVILSQVLVVNNLPIW